MVVDHNNVEALRDDMSWASSLEPLTDRKLALPTLSEKLLAFWFDGDSSKVWSLLQTTTPRDELAYLTPVCLMSNKEYDMFLALRAKAATYLTREQQLHAVPDSRQRAEASAMQVKNKISYPMADGSSCNAIVVAKAVIPQVLQPNVMTYNINFSQNMKPGQPWISNQILNYYTTERTNDPQDITTSFSSGSSQNGNVKMKKPRGRPPKGPKTSASSGDQTNFSIQTQPYRRTSLATMSPRAKKFKTKASSKREASIRQEEGQEANSAPRADHCILESSFAKN